MRSKRSRIGTPPRKTDARLSPNLSRRNLLATAAAVASAALPLPALTQGAGGRVAVVGSGFAGATCARFLRRIDPRIGVTLVEASPVFVACPLSNAVIAGLRDIEAQQFGLEKLADDGVVLTRRPAIAIDTQARIVTLTDNARVSYDRLVLAPGIDFNWNALPGYSEAASERMPHAWKAGEQTLLLRRQLEAMEDGGTVVMSAPANPFRCPPGPYERASLIAYYLKTKKPKSKLIVLDAKDAFSKQRLFQNAWKELYPEILEWVPLSAGGKVTSVDAANMTLVTEFGKHKASVANVIPPQKAGRIAEGAGVTDRSGWCPVDPVTFESRQQPNIHVIGDAAIMGAMPKSAFVANAQAKVCAAAVARLLSGGQPDQPKLINTCYSLVAPDYGISIAGVYQAADGQLKEVEGSGGISPIDAPSSTRALEARLANAWFRTITEEVFG
jgi:sulfide dehydrogenase [flavocytochrome c] flavoprotein chain